MKIATTTADFNFYVNTYEDRIKELHRAGFRYIDLNMYSFTPNCVYMQDNWKDAVYRLKTVADELGMTFVQAHSQGGNPLWKDPERVDFLLKATIRSIEICELLGIKNTVVHAGCRRGLSREEWFAENKAFYQKLFPAMERCGVNVLCENSSEQNIGKGCYYLYSGKDMREFIDYVGHPQFGGCWDTGHANMVGPQYGEILALGDKLWAIHYNDNRGERDDHVVPFLGTVNHDEIMTALTDVGFRGYFTLECDSSLLKYNKRRHFRDESGDLKLRNPELFMQRHIEALLYDAAKWILQSYGLFEE
ncbi:MAG: sugar phosphate isomerase/epimerase [Clostridia bacterium]|nr:sugar phosphate isomerase/epimerase [Clostridia bacterium]